MRVAAPADKRFRRAHVSPRRKRVLDRGTWTKAGIIAGAVVAVTTAAYVGITAIVSSTALTITTITVEGAVRMPEGVVQEELADLDAVAFVDRQVHDAAGRVGDRSDRRQRSLTPG